MAPRTNPLEEVPIDVDAIRREQIRSDFVAAYQNLREILREEGESGEILARCDVFLLKYRALRSEETALQGADLTACRISFLSDHYPGLCEGLESLLRAMDMKIRPGQEEKLEQVKAECVFSLSHALSVVADDSDSSTSDGFWGRIGRNLTVFKELMIHFGSDCSFSKFEVLWLLDSNRFVQEVSNFKLMHSRWLFEQDLS